MRTSDDRVKPTGMCRNEHTNPTRNTKTTTTTTIKTKSNPQPFAKGKVKKILNLKAGKVKGFVKKAIHRQYSRSEAKTRTERITKEQNPRVRAKAKAKAEAKAKAKAKAKAPAIDPRTGVCYVGFETLRASAAKGRRARKARSKAPRKAASNKRTDLYDEEAKQEACRYIKSQTRSG